MNFILQNILRYAYNRLMEISTWRNIILLCLGTWGKNNPELLDSVVSYSFIIIGILGSILPDKIPALAFLKSSKENINTQVKDTLEKILNDDNQTINNDNTQQQIYEDIANLNLPPSIGSTIRVSKPNIPIVQSNSNIKTNNNKPTQQHRQLPDVAKPTESEPTVGFGDKY